MMLTSDQNISDLDYTVLYRIKDAGQFLFNLRDPEETVKVISESVIREVGASSIRDMGKVMGQLKQGYSDTIDFSKAGALIKELLNK